MAKKRIKVGITDVKVGDRVVFNDGKEKLTVTIKKINIAKGEIDVTWRRRETYLVPSDFTNGYIYK